jgi:choline-glycine betaine transporter
LLCDVPTATGQKTVTKPVTHLYFYNNNNEMMMMIIIIITTIIFFISSYRSLQNDHGHVKKDITTEARKK